MLKTSVSTEIRMSNVLWSEMKEYALQTKGKDKFQTLAEQGSPELKEFLLSNILAISKTKGSFLLEFYEVWKKNWPDPTGVELSHMLRWVAKQNLNTMMTIFLKIGTPHFIAQRFPSIWNHFFNYGELVICSAHDHSMEFQLTDTTPYGEGICMGTLGWTRGALEKSGAHNVMTTHPVCSFRGDSQCIFKIKWD